MSESLTISSSSGDLAARLHRPQGRAWAGVVIAHGLYSSMASDKLTRLAQALARAGFFALQFDASGCGGSPGEVSRTTLTSRRDELLAAAAALAQAAPDLPLVYLGSSLGGTASLLAGDLRPPAATVCWSTPTDPAALLSRPGSQAHQAPLMAMQRDLMGHDMEAVLARTGRVLFVHGEQDEVVPVGQARRGYELARPPKDLLILPGADHRLSSPADQNLAMDHTLAWLEQTLA